MDPNGNKSKFWAFGDLLIDNFAQSFFLVFNVRLFIAISIPRFCVCFPSCSWDPPKKKKEKKREKKKNKTNQNIFLNKGGTTPNPRMCVVWGYTNYYLNDNSILKHIIFSRKPNKFITKNCLPICRSLFDCCKHWKYFSRHWFLWVKSGMNFTISELSDWK